MLMKKSVLAFSVLALAISSESALAAADVQFFGSVTDTTCDLVPHTDGAVNNLVQLGSVKTKNVGQVQDFSLKADASQSGCGNLSGKVATIYWSGPFNEKGLAPQAGLATDAWTEIKGTNSTTPNQAINSTQLSTDFDATKLTTDGAQYSAQLHGGEKVGDYRSAAAFVVTYN